MRRFIERYPVFLRRSPEFRDLQEALEPELLELRRSFEARAAKRFPVPPQLRRRDAGKAEDAEAFLV